MRGNTHPELSEKPNVPASAASAEQAHSDQRSTSTTEHSSAQSPSASLAATATSSASTKDSMTTPQTSQNPTQTSGTTTSLFSAPTNQPQQAPASVTDTFEPLSSEIILRLKAQGIIPAKVTADQFRQLAVDGKEAAAAIVLEANDLSWYTRRGHSKEDSGRVFDKENIASPFEINLLDLDEFMCERMIDDVGQKKLPTMKPSAAHKFCTELLEQYYHVKNNGLTYTIPMRNGLFSLFRGRQTISDMPGGSLKRHIDALHKFVNDVGWDLDERDKYWLNDIGGQYGTQWWLPAHVIQEYGRRDSSFSPCPTSRKRLISGGVDHREDFNVADWYDTATYSSYGTYTKGGQSYCSRVGIRLFADTLPRLAALDLEATKALYNERLRAFLALEHKLRHLLAQYPPEAQSQPSRELDTQNPVLQRRQVSGCKPKMD